MNQAADTIMAIFGFKREKETKCKCGFKFSKYCEFRNCEVYRDENGQAWGVCPNCGAEYESD